MPVENLGWLASLINTLAAPLKAVAARLARSIENRKPKLFVHFNPPSLLWCIANSGPLEWMQLTLSANFNHDDPDQTLVIVDAYLKGATPQLEMQDKFDVPPETIVDQRVVMFVAPVIREKGKDWTGRIVFVDQFRRTYKSAKVTFRWAGPPLEKVNS